MLEILKGNDRGVASDPARAAPAVNIPVSTTTHEPKPAAGGGGKSQQVNSALVALIQP